MTASTKTKQHVHPHHFAESEGGLWDSEDQQLLDPKVIEPRMYLARPGSESGWGFHHRAELLNGRLAMLGFVIGLGVEALTGAGILQQLGLGALVHLG